MSTVFMSLHCGRKLKDKKKKAHTDIEWIVKAACCEVAQQPPGSRKLSYSIINKVMVSLEMGAHIWTLKSNTSYIQWAFWKSLLK